MEKEIKRESFVFYKSYYDCTEGLNDTEKVKVYEMIFNYAFFGELPQECGPLKSIFLIVKPLIDNSYRRYKASVENGKKGGKPKTKYSNDEQKIFQLYEENIGAVTFDIKKTLSYQISKYGVELVELALFEAAANNVLKIQYIVAILTAWGEDGIKTAEEAQKRIDKHKAVNITNIEKSRIEKLMREYEENGMY